ncbi:MAG TPA: DUF2232 domain-containing protein [Candidatus Bathyarchaeia archaeon]|nr:DUF2232 domain-containing protein [Candidatus Bathyarchaeia archaeon]
MSTRKKQWTDSAWMLVTASLLYYLGTHTILGVIAFFLISVPFALLGTQLALREKSVVTILFALLGLLLDGPMGTVLALQSALTGLVMATLYGRKKHAVAAIAGGAGVNFLTFVFFLFLLHFVMNIDLMAELDRTKQEIINGTKDMLFPAVMSPDEWKKQVEMQFEMIRTILPTFMILMSLIIGGLIHAFTRLGGKIFRREIPALPPLRDWNFPRSLLVYYFLSLIILLLSGEDMKHTFWGNALENLKVMLEVIFLVQGLSFCMFGIYLKKWKIPSPVLIVSLFIFPGLTYILSLLGIFDLGLGLRKRLETRVKRG